MFRVGPRTPLLKIAGSLQSMPGEGTELDTDTAGALSWRTVKGRRLPFALENVEKQHDENQRIVFVLVHAGEERHARLGPRGRLVVCLFVLHAS